MTLTQISSRGVEDTLRWSLGASGTNHYTFTGPGLTGTVNDPTIYLSRGQTYIFENNNSSNAHPFQIQSVAGQGGAAYNTGVTNNGGAGGTEIKIEVPHNAPDNLYYQCTAHPNMGGTIFITGAVADNSISSAKITDDTIVNADINTGAAITGTKIDTTTFGGTTGLKLPEGGNSTRVNTTGLIRFNSDLGLPEYYNGSTYIAIDSPPVITSVSPTEVDSTASGNETFTITGERFSIGATVKFISGTGTQITPNTVTRDSATQLSVVATRSSFVNAQEPYSVKVINASGLATEKADQINVDSTPTWNTAAGSLGAIGDTDTGNHFTLSATDAEGDTISYSETGGTNIAGAGLTLNSSTGVISGDPTDVSSATTVNFTARATANSKTVDRNFSFIVNPIRRVQFAMIGAGGGGGAQDSAYQTGSNENQGIGGCGSFITFTLDVVAGTTLYHYIGNGGRGGVDQSRGQGGTGSMYHGGQGGYTGVSDGQAGGGGGDLVALLQNNAISKTSVLAVAGSGGGGAGRPAGGGFDESNGGGGIAASDGSGLNGAAGEYGTLYIHNNSSNDPLAKGGQKNAGGGGSSAGSSEWTSGSAGILWYGGNSENGWGGGGGGAGSSYIRGLITDYTDSDLNNGFNSTISYVTGAFTTQSYGHTGGNLINNDSSRGSGVRGNNGEPSYRMSSVDFSNLPSGALGSINQGAVGYGGVDGLNDTQGDSGGPGLIMYKVGSGSWQQIQAGSNAIGSFTIS